MPGPLERLRAALPKTSPLQAEPALDAWLEQTLAGARTRWTDLDLDADWPRWLVAHLDDPSMLPSLLGPDLLLASCALAGSPTAQGHFDAILKVEVRRAVSPLDTSNALVDEVTQLTRERLLLGGSSGQPRLADYAGQGSLAAWIRAVAVRLALNAKRPGAREDPVDVLPDQPLADPDPELALLRSRYRDQFRAAFTRAMGALSARDRTLLRLTALDGLTLARVGQMYGKDTSTISRWLAAARGELLESTRGFLAETLKLDSLELDSVMRAADSELNLSISRLLESQTGSSTG